MRYKVKRSIVLYVIFAIIGTGCGKREVDYSIDIETEVNTESEQYNETSLEQFRNQEIWTDEVSIEGADGVKFPITIEASAQVPELESMRVIELTPLSSDITFKNQCLENFFGVDTEYYYHEKENYTKEELERWLPEETELIAKASDTRIVAEEFESVSQYAAYRDEILYEIYLTDADMAIYPNWEETAKCGPPRFRDYVYVDFGGMYQEGDKNDCIYTMEEAQGIANDYMKEIGLGAMECTARDHMTWRGNSIEENSETADEFATYGYIFEYATGMDGLSFDQYPKTHQYVTDYDDTDLPDGGIIQGEYFFKQDNYQGEIVGGSGKARIIVTDDGIYSVSIENAEIIENASNALALLPLDAIQTIILDEIVECNTKYNISENYNKYNSLQLIYFKVGDESGHKISVIPVWCCSYYASDYYNHPIFVNAIDGTIIHYADAEWAGVDATPHKPRRKFY